MVDLEATKDSKFKLIVPSVKRDFKGLMLKGFSERIHYYEYFYFDNFAEAEKHNNLLKTDKAFIVEMV